MRPYEMMIILDPDVEERTIATTIDKLMAVVPREGGKIDNVDIWGRRRMAYAIKKRTDGFYAVIDFTASSDTAKELERQLGLNESVLRIKILRKDGKSVGTGEAKKSKPAKVAEAAAAPAEAA